MSVCVITKYSDLLARKKEEKDQGIRGFNKGGQRNIPEGVIYVQQVKGRSYIPTFFSRPSLPGKEQL